MVCYRHPRNETAVSCSDCERPICTDCMVFGPVGIRCPECAGTGATSGHRGVAARARTVATTGGGAIVTKALIVGSVAVFLLQLVQSSDVRGLDSEVFRQGALYGPLVAEGEWWRLLTSAFLHAGFIHVLFNMLMLWWFGRALEELLGRSRFLGIYLVSALAGAAGSLLLAPTTPTVGASGAVFGILGAGLLLERRQVYVFGGAAFGVVVLNLVFSFVLANISIGGHIGGLAGGMLAMLALSQFGRTHIAYGRAGLLGALGLVAIAGASIAIAYARVRGYA